MWYPVLLHLVRIVPKTTKTWILKLCCLKNALSLFTLLKLMRGRSWLFVSWTLKFLPAPEIYSSWFICASCQHNVNLPSSEHKSKEACIFLSSTQRQSTDSCLTWRELYCLPNKGLFQTLTHISVSQKETDRYSSHWNLADFLQEVCEESQGWVSGLVSGHLRALRWYLESY